MNDYLYCTCHGDHSCGENRNCGYCLGYGRDVPKKKKRKDKSKKKGKKNVKR